MMRKKSLYAAIATILLLGVYSQVHAQQIPLEQVILDEECTIDIIDMGSGPQTVYTCPTPEPTPTLTPSPDPDPPKPTVSPAAPNVGAPNTGYYAKRAAPWVLLIVGLVLLWYLLVYKRRRRDDEPKTRTHGKRSTTKKASVKHPATPTPRSKSAKKRANKRP